MSSQEQPISVGVLLAERRKALGLSRAEVARRVGITDSSLLRFEDGTISRPRPDVLKTLAETLDLDLADLYAAAGYVQPTSLPSFAPYLRSKYAGLPASATRELEASFARIAAKHGYDPRGPNPGEDETE